MPLREANVALQLNGLDVAFDQPSRNGYVSPDLRSGYLSATTVDGERVAINLPVPPFAWARRIGAAIRPVSGRDGLAPALGPAL